MTERVTATGHHAVMTATERETLENCDAVMVALGNRRYVIIRRDEPTELRSLDPRRSRIRDLQPGDQVVYKGQQTFVRSLQVY